MAFCKERAIREIAKCTRSVPCSGAAKCDMTCPFHADHKMSEGKPVQQVFVPSRDGQCLLDWRGHDKTVRGSHDERHEESAYANAQ
jgi:hypothetical protein